jgi:two-component system nitrate/nitrite response regulator NarL
VLLLLNDVPGERVLGLVSRGLSGACSTSDGLAEVADAVMDVAAGGVVLPPPLVADVVTQWRSSRHRDKAASEAELTLREMEVLNAMAEGLPTKATARLLGVAIKTVETHKTRVFAKLGVRNQAQLVWDRARDRTT